MSRFKYTDEELQINKVLKRNHDTSAELLADQKLINTRMSADDNITSSIALLKNLEKEKSVKKLLKKVETQGKERKLKHRPQLEEWETILNETDVDVPENIILEDILSDEELQSAFNEADEINKQFARKTSIVNKTDLAFLAIATALQVAKSLVFPYIAEKFDYSKNFDSAKRLDHNDKSIEKTHRASNDKFRDKHIEKHGSGDWINILYQTVPYDITKGSKSLGINIGGKYHRMYTLGHDPILGWLFGTANILTDCITFNDFHTNRISRADPVTGGKKMVITPEVVFMGQMFKECYDEVRADFLNLPVALFVQAQHLRSDEFTKLGLPVPLLSSFNEDFAGKLYRENYDALCFARDAQIVGASFAVSKLIDIIITLTHGLFRRENENKYLYDVRTRKILLVSNTIASTSTIINTAITNNPKNLDIGSLLNTMTHLFSDIGFITKIKKEFVENEISDRLEKEIAKVDTLYKGL